MTASNATVPDTLDQALSPEWLTAALSARYPGIKVTEVEPGPVVSRVSTNARFRITCADGLPDGLPAELCVKGYFYDTGSRQAGLPEAYFYRELAAESGIRTLRSHYADVDLASNHGVLITEDVIAQGAVFLDGTSDYTPEQTAQSLTELAKLHAATWSNPRWADAAWLTPRFGSTLRARGVPEINGNFHGPNGVDMPDAVRDAQRLVDVYKMFADEVSAAQPWTVLHGDTHVGNVYLDGAGRPSWLDWQCVQRGPWYVDVGYHIASALTVEDRRAHERDLLRHYLDELGSRGVEVPSWDDAWNGIRRGMVHGFFFWAITLKVAPPIIASLLHRIGTAVADHDSLAAVAQR